MVDCTVAALLLLLHGSEQQWGWEESHLVNTGATECQITVN